MDILEQRKRRIQQQYDSILHQILSEKKGQINQGNQANNHLLIQSRKALKDHESNNPKCKYLGKMKIYTLEGAKIIPCSCSKLGLTSCESITQTPSSKESIQFDDQTIKIQKSLKSVRSEKYFSRAQRNLQDPTSATVLSSNSQKKRQWDSPEYFTQTGSFKSIKTEFQSPKKNDPYGISSRLRNQGKYKYEYKFPRDPIFLKSRLTQNECSFCRKKCETFTCQTCQKFTGRR